MKVEVVKIKVETRREIDHKVQGAVSIRVQAKRI